jgi:hypothetical protein
MRFIAAVLLSVVVMQADGLLSPCTAYELRSKYATIIYDNPEDLRRYNKELTSVDGCGPRSGNIKPTPSNRKSLQK